MELQQIIKRQLIPTGINNNKYIPTDTTDIVYDNDRLYSDLSDLVNNQFRAWYCKMFYQLGKDRVLILASQARQDGKHKQKLFSKLLKDASEKASKRQ